MEASGTTTKEGDTDGIPKTGNRQRENSDESQWSGENEVQIFPKTGGPKIKRKHVRREDILTGSSKRDIRPYSRKIGTFGRIPEKVGVSPVGRFGLGTSKHELTSNCILGSPPSCTRKWKQALNGRSRKRAKKSPSWTEEHGCKIGAASKAKVVAAGCDSPTEKV